MAEIESVLKLEKLVFDKILFERHGFKNDLELKMNMQVRFSQKQENGMYLVVLILKGMKPNEYDFEINLFFGLHIAAEGPDAIVEGDIGIGILFVEQLLHPLHHHIAGGIVHRGQQKGKNGG